MSHLRHRVDTVFGRHTARHYMKKVCARNLWHLAARLLLKVLNHSP